MIRKGTVALLLAGTALAGCGSMPAVPVQASNGVLVNSAGMTLYTFDNDSAGRSACNDQCAAIWPPLRAGAEDKAGGAYSIITRADGSRQWAYEGKPLYLWVRDQKPGDRTGDGVNSVWHVVKTSGSTQAQVIPPGMPGAVSTGDAGGY